MMYYAHPWSWSGRDVVLFLMFAVEWGQQRAVLEPAMKGRDLIARAKTGTGKTLAFGIPIIRHLVEEDEQSRRSG